MTQISPETNRFLDDLEKYSQRLFKYRHDLGVLLDTAKDRSLNVKFDELIFLGKFVSNAHDVLQRSGKDNPESVKLAYEYQKNLERAREILLVMIGNLQDDEQKSFKDRFIRLSHDHLNNLLAFLYELSWIKNYYIDRE